MERWYDVFESIEYLDVEILYKLKEFEKKPEMLMQYFKSLYGMNTRSNPYVLCAYNDAKDRMNKKKNENILKARNKREQKSESNENKLLELMESLDKLGIGDVLEYYKIIETSKLMETPGIKNKCKDTCFDSKASIIKQYGTKVNVLLNFIRKKFNDDMPRVVYGIYGGYCDAYPRILVNNIMKDPNGLEWLKSVGELSLL